MNYLLRLLAFALVVEGVCAQNIHLAQQTGVWNLMVVELSMYPGSSVQYIETAIATYESQSQCEAARRNIYTKFNSSTKCTLKKKSKVKV
jgi:hypothetical protein